MPVVHVSWGPETDAETFASYATGAAPAGWTPRWGGGATWEVVTDVDSEGGQSLQGSHASNGRRLLSWDAAGQQGDVEVLSMLSSDTDALTVDGLSAANQNRLYARAGGTSGVENAVFVGLTGGDDVLKVETYRDGSSAQLTTTESFAWAAGDRIMIRFRVVGNDVKVKAWIPAAPEDPLNDEPSSWNFEGTQSTVTASGWVGVGFYSQPGVRTFEWVSFATGGGTAQAPA